MFFIQFAVPYSGRLTEESESVELLRSGNNILMFCNIHYQQPLNKPVHKTFGGEKKKERHCDVPFVFSFQHPFCFVGDLLRIYFVVYQHIVCHIQQFNRI